MPHVMSKGYDIVFTVDTSYLNLKYLLIGTQNNKTDITKCSTMQNYDPP